MEQIDLVTCIELMCGTTLSLFAYKIAHTKTCSDSELRISQAQSIREELEHTLEMLDCSEECFRLSVEDHVETSTSRTSITVAALEGTCALLPNDTGYREDLSLAREEHRITSEEMSQLEVEEMNDVSSRLDALKSQFQAQLSEVTLIM